MFTQQDLKQLRKIQNQYLERKSSEQNSCSGMEHKTEQELYISKYLLNDNLKILHIEIVGTEEAQSLLAPYDTYINYVLKILTEDFSYEIKKRYSQFLKLYEKIKTFQTSRSNYRNLQQKNKININNYSKNQYSFPIKKISSSLRHFFHVSNKIKLAQERKSQLSSFVNQIRNNYYKNPDLFIFDYIELLKFISMRQQHQKFWKRKEGRILQNSNLPNQIKNNQKQNQQINVQYLSELLQHQMNKINLAIIAKQSVYKSSPNLINTSSEIKLENDILVADEIIKSVDSVRDIVFELKKKINYDHIRCIIKGKDIKPTASSLTKTRNGLIQYCLKYSNNQIVTIHILRTILFVFVNSECIYSSDAFVKVIAELELISFVLNQDKQQLCLSNKQFRQLYFKLLKLYIDSKEQYGNDKKHNQVDKFQIEKLMGLSLVRLFEVWCQNNKKNKQFKLKDDQKDWKLVIQNFPRSFSPKKTHQSFNIIKIKTQNNQQPHVHFRKLSKLNYEKESLKQVQFQEAKFGIIKNFQNQNMSMELTTQEKEEKYTYFLSSKIKNRSYQKCLEIMKREETWNPLIIHTQTDVYSNTRKDCLQIPGKQQRMFRFVQQQEIEMNLHDEDEDDKPQKQLELTQYQNYIALGNQQDQNQHQTEKNPKKSTQTMPSTSGSCAHEHKPQQIYNEPHQNLASSKLSHKFILIKSPPEQGVCNSYYQRIQIERLPRQGKYKQPCGIQIQIVLTETSSKKYFVSEISGGTQYIWEGFKKAFQMISKRQE